MEVVEHRARVMASELHIAALAPPPGAIAAALVELRRLEALWSRFLPDSDISRINRAAGVPVDVADPTLVLVASMIEGWRITDGAYDPTLLPATVALGDAASAADPTRRTTLLASSRPGGMGGVELDLDARTVTVPVGTTLDAGGIGKGLAADLVVGTLLRDGTAGALIGIGGDLAIAGEAPVAEGWVIAVEAPDFPGRPLCSFAVSGGGVATSSTRSRRWIADGTERHHVIDPVTFAPSTTDLASVTVVAGSGWEAEVFATAALLRGRTAGLATLEHEGVSAIAVSSDGTVTATRDLVGVLRIDGSTW